MSRGRKTEQEVATDLVLFAMQEAGNAWPTINKTFKDTFKEKFNVENETMAPFDLALAVIAQNLQAIKNVFPSGQASRIEQWILKCLDTEDYGEYALQEIKKYDHMFQKSVSEITNKDSSFYGTNPLDVISVCLLKQWLAHRLRDFEVEINGKKTGVISPVLVSMTSSTLVAFILQWKTIKADYDIVE